MPYLFWNGCTAEVVSSDKGFTNHHWWATKPSQNASTVEHNYLRDGFVEQGPCGNSK
jgi:hypothetical protein